MESLIYLRMYQTDYYQIFSIADDQSNLHFLITLLLPSSRQHPRYDVHLVVVGEYYLARSANLPTGLYI